jgi:hypothetical protein
MNSVALKYGLSAPVVSNHYHNHISRQMVQSVKLREVEHHTDLLERIDSIVARAEKIFRRNYEARKDGIALKALDSQRMTFELLAKISFALHEAERLAAEASKQDDSSQANEEMEQAIKILTMDELDVFFKISQKLETQDETIDVLAGYTKAGTYIHPEEDRPLTRRKPLKRQEIELIETDATEEPVQEVTKPDHPLKVKPVNSVEIGYTPWDEHPLNPKYHLRMERERWDKKNMKRIP